MRAPARTIPLLLVALAGLALAALGGCERRRADPHPARPAVELDDAVVERLLAAMRELRDLSVADPRSGGRPMPIGLGITALLGEERCEPIVRRHGFANCRDFESRLGYVQAILMEHFFAERRGFDADAQAYRVRAAIQAAQAELSQLDQDPNVGEAERRLERTRLRGRIEELEERLAEIDEVAEAIDQQFAGVPDQARRAVERRLDEIAALVVPQLVAAASTEEDG